MLLEREMAVHASILTWRIPWTEGPGGLQSRGSQRVGHDWVTITHSLCPETLLTGLLVLIASLCILYDFLHTWSWNLQTDIVLLHPLQLRCLWFCFLTCWRRLKPPVKCGHELTGPCPSFLPPGRLQASPPSVPWAPGMSSGSALFLVSWVLFSWEGVGFSQIVFLHLVGKAFTAPFKPWNHLPPCLPLSPSPNAESPWKLSESWNYTLAARRLKDWCRPLGL